MQVAQERHLRSLNEQLRKARNRVRVLSDQLARDAAGFHANGGVSYNDIAKVLGVSRPRGQQIVERGNSLDHRS